MSSTYLAHGIVLSRRAYREVDRIVTIFTDEYGKIDAIARGVRKPLSKLAGHLEPFSYSAFMFATGRTFDVLATSVKRSSFRIPQTDVLSFALASYFFEAVDRLTRPRQPDRELLRLCVRFLELFEASLDPHGGTPAFQRVLLTEYFLYQLVTHLGFAPMLDHCVVGKEALGTGNLYFYTALGGLVCHKHRGQNGAFPLSPQTAEMLRLMADQQLEALRFVHRTRETLSELTRTMNTILTYHLSEQLVSRALVRDILHAYEAETPHATT